MEEKISFRGTMEVTKIFGLVTLSSILLQAVAHIVDCKIPLFNINEMDYVIPEINISSYTNKIVQPNLEFEWGNFGKDYPQMISLAKARTLKPPDIVGMIPTMTHSSWTLNKNIRNKIYATLRRNRDLEWNREIQTNKMNIRISEQRSESTLSRKRQPEGKENSRYLESRIAINKISDSRRQAEHGTDFAALSLRRSLESSSSRRSKEARNPVRENRSNRRMNDEKARNKSIRSQDRCKRLSHNIRQTDSYVRNYFLRLVGVEQRRNQLERYGRLQITSSIRENNEKQPRIYFIRPDQERRNSEKPTGKHDLMVEERKSQNKFASISKVQLSQRFMRSAKKHTKTQERIIAMERRKCNQFLWPRFQASKIPSDRRSIAQIMRSFISVYHASSHNEPPANIRLFRKVARFTSRVEEARHSDIRDVDERRTKSSVHRGQDEMRYRDIRDRTSLKRGLRRYMERSSNFIIAKQLREGDTHNVKQLNDIPTKTFSLLLSQIFIKGIQDSQRQVKSLQQTRDRGFERLVQRDERRIINLDNRHEDRQHQKHSERQQARYVERKQRLFRSENVANVKSLHSNIANRYRNSITIQTSERIQYPDFSGRFLNTQNNYLTLSRTLVRREVDNRVSSERVQRTQDREFSPIRYTISSERFAERILHSKLTQRSFDSRHDDKYSDRRIDETSNARNQYRMVRGVQHPKNTATRSDNLISNRIRNIFQDKTRSREHRYRFHDKRRNELVSEISYNDRRYFVLYRKQSNARKLYRNAEQFISNVAEARVNVAERISRESTDENRESSVRIIRVISKLKASRIEITITPSIEERHHLKAFGVQSHTRKLPEMRRIIINEGIKSQKVTSLESIMPYQISLRSENENLISNLWNTVTNILNIFSKASYNTLGWKAACNGNSLNNIEMKQKQFPQDREGVKGFLDNWKQSYGVKDAVIAGIGIFAAVKLQSIKTV